MSIDELSPRVTALKDNAAHSLKVQLSNSVVPSRRCRHCESVEVYRGRSFEPVCDDAVVTIKELRSWLAVYNELMDNSGDFSTLLNIFRHIGNHLSGAEIVLKTL